MSNLTALIALAAADLKDAAHDIWSTAELTAHLRRALRELDLAAPVPTAATLTLASSSRALDLSTLGELVELWDVWHPYDAAAPAQPPTRPAWRWLSASAIWLELDAPPDGAQAVRLLYGAPHTVDGLDGATATTLDRYGEDLLVLGATASAAEQLALARTGAVTVAGFTPDQLARWAQERRRRFERGLAQLAVRRARPADPRLSWDEAV